MKKYDYYISAVFDDGLSSEDSKASTRKEAFKKLAVIRERIAQHLKDYDSVELGIVRAAVDDDVNYEDIYYKKLK